LKRIPPEKLLIKTNTTFDNNSGILSYPYKWMQEIQHTDLVLRGIKPQKRKLDLTKLVRKNIVAVIVGLVAIGLGAFIYRKYYLNTLTLFIFNK